MLIPRCGALSAFLVMAMSVSTPASAEPPLPDGWRVLNMPGKPVTRFAAAPDGAIAVNAKDSVGFLYSDASSIPGTGRYLTWRWRVNAAPPATDLSMKGMDDRPLAVHVWFKDEADTDSGWDLRTRLGAWLSNRPLPGKMLTYVWGGRAAPGTGFRNPYRETAGQIIVLRSGNESIGQWFEETVDISADFESAFGYAPGAPAYIAISADTDDKGGSSTGMVAGLAFKSAP